MLDGNQCMTTKERKNPIEKELEHAVLVNRRKKKNHILEFLECGQNMKYIVKIQGKQFKKTVLPISKALESCFTLFWRRRRRIESLTMPEAPEG